MRLDAYQLGLSELLRGSVPADQQEYFCTVQDSAGLAVVREIVRWWRAFGVEQTCPLTARLLREAGTFDLVIDTFCNSQPFSAYIDPLGSQFLTFVEGLAEPLAAAVAGTERALVS